MKFPAAPESIKAVVEIELPWTSRHTGRVRLDTVVCVLTFELTGGDLDEGRTGQEDFMCPD